jgi:hypothetical protein
MDASIVMGVGLRSIHASSQCAPATSTRTCLRSRSLLRGGCGWGRILVLFVCAHIVETRAVLA